MNEEINHNFAATSHRQPAQQQQMDLATFPINNTLTSKLQATSSIKKTHFHYANVVISCSKQTSVRVATLYFLCRCVASSRNPQRTTFLEAQMGEGTSRKSEIGGEN